MSPADPPAGPPPEEPTQPLDAQAIGRELDRISRWAQKASEARGWDDDLRDIWKSLRHLGDGLTALLAPAKEGSQSWLLQVGEDPETLTERLADLVEWLDAVYLRFPGTELPSCWLGWHPWVVEELLWLRGYHAQAYGPQGGPVARGMWHDQSRPRLVERIRKDVGGCDLSKHVPAGQAAKDPIAAPLAGHIHAIAEAWSTTGLPPEPTDEQLDDARKHRELKLRRP
jgi:hypothetical protein